MTTESTAPRPADGSPVSARLRIVGWMVLTAAVGLASLIVTVDPTMQADVAGRANTTVEQKLAEFSQFAAQGMDPETAQPFASGAKFTRAGARDHPGHQLDHDAGVGSTRCTRSPIHVVNSSSHSRQA